MGLFVVYRGSLVTNALTWGHIAAARRLIQDARPERLTLVLERWMEVNPDAPGLQDFLADLRRSGVPIVSPAADIAALVRDSWRQGQPVPLAAIDFLAREALEADERGETISDADLVRRHHLDPDAQPYEIVDDKPPWVPVPMPPLGARRVMPQFILAWWAKVVP